MSIHRVASIGPIVAALVALAAPVVAESPSDRGHWQTGTAIEAVPVVAVDRSPTRLVVGDEIDALAEQLQPPERWADHQADWQVEWRSFSFAHHGGSKTKRYRIVRDGERIVAVIRSGDILQIPQTPADAEAVLRMPTERHHLDNLVGSSLPTWPFIRKVKTHGAIYEELGDQALPRERFERGPAHLDYIRSQTLPAYSVEARFRFTADPVFGYRIDAIREVVYADAPTAPIKLGAGTFTPGCYVPWAYAAVYDRTVYTPSSGGLKGWANNCVTMDRCDADAKTFDWRDGGFIAYLTDREGWGRCYTRQDGAGPTDKLRVCNAHNDFHITLHVEPPLATDAQGRPVLRYVHRLLHLPPEMSAWVWDEVELLGTGQSSLLIRLGEAEDFEDARLPLTEPGRGLIWTARHPPIVQGVARSGEHSILIQGRQWPNLPQVSLLPETRYRLAGWYRVTPWTEAQWQEARDREAKRRAKRQAQGKAVGDPTDWEAAEPRAFISADFYEWSPYSGEMLERLRTNSVGPQGGEWQYVELEFTAPAWGPFVNIAFHAEYCEAHLDDFELTVIDATAD